MPIPASSEAVCLLSELKMKQHIEVNIDLDELNTTRAEARATYEKIKAWVWEHYHFEVVEPIFLSGQE